MAFFHSFEQSKVNPICSEFYIELLHQQSRPWKKKWLSLRCRKGNNHSQDCLQENGVSWLFVHAVVLLPFKLKKFHPLFHIISNLFFVRIFVWEPIWDTIVPTLSFFNYMIWLIKKLNFNVVHFYSFFFYMTSIFC